MKPWPSTLSQKGSMSFAALVGSGELWLVDTKITINESGSRMISLWQRMGQSFWLKCQELWRKLRLSWQGTIKWQEIWTRNTWKDLECRCKNGRKKSWNILCNIEVLKILQKCLTDYVCWCIKECRWEIFFSASIIQKNSKVEIKKFNVNMTLGFNLNTFILI